MNNQEPELHQNQAEKLNPEGDQAALAPEVIDKIKHPPAIDHVMRELPPEERRNIPAMAPEMLDEPSDEMTSFTRD